MIIVSAPFLRACQLYSGVGADIVMESISLISGVVSAIACSPRVSVTGPGEGDDLGAGASVIGDLHVSNADSDLARREGYHDGTACSRPNL